ncbi:MAG: hypothetical protein QXV69_03690 [Sulfolobaceae archaeon]
MEFLSKRERLVVVTAAEGGQAGIAYNSLYNSLSLLLSRDSIQKALEELYLKGYINLVKIDNEIRIIVSKQVRKSIALLEFYKSLVLKLLQEVKEKLDEINDEKERKRILESASQQLSVIILNTILSLLNENPELTIPEFIESILTLKEPLQALGSISIQLRGKELFESLIKIIGKYVGEEDSKAVAKLLENMLS